MEIRKPADARFAKGLIFSPPGNGKTHLLGTAQEDERTSPMLLLDFEGGLESLSGLDIDTVPVIGWDDYNEAFELLSSDSKENIYKSVGIDSASETHIWALLQILDAQRDRREGSERRDPDSLEQGDYGKAMTQMRRLLREFRDLPMHVFYTATTKEITERGVGTVKVPAMAGQMADEIVALMSIVGYLAIDADPESEVERVLLLQNYPGFRTKVRAPWMKETPDEVEDPTIGKILDAFDFTARPKRRGKAAAPKEDDE